jgi:Crp-like helix-turn-helix protein
MGADEFPLTQEFVAMMLGATRPTVTLVAGALQRAGLITFTAAMSRFSTASDSNPPHASATARQRSSCKR